jgi:hypothetical protein
MDWYIYPIIILLICFAFRKKILEIVNELWVRHKEKQKRTALMRRLYQNSEGKFNQKEYLKSVQVQKKAQLKKNREKQEDARK